MILINVATQSINTKENLYRPTDSECCWLPVQNSSTVTEEQTSQELKEEKLKILKINCNKINLSKLWE